MADAFKIANGFLPVNVEFPAPVPTRLLVPDDLSLSLIILLFNARLVVYPFGAGAPGTADWPLLELEDEESVLLLEAVVP